MSNYLYMEINGIQRFVFAAPRLKAIRGGSAMLDLFNRDKMPKKVKEHGGNVVFVGGGHCLANGLTRENADRVATELSRELRNLTQGQVTLSWGIAVDEDRDWANIRNAYLSDLKQRSLNPPPGPPPLPPFVAMCSLCGQSPAVGLQDMKERHLKPTCSVCVGRMEMNNKARDLIGKTVWNRLHSHLKQYGYKGDDEVFKAQVPHGEFENLAESSSGAGYLAYLYCDGNRMGHVLSNAEDAKKYGELSTIVDQALHAAVAKGLMEHCKPRSLNDKFSAEVLMLGGDDLIVALPGDIGVSFTCSVIDEFYTQTKEKFRLSAGLVFAPHTTPITILQKVATDLLHSAKRHAYLDETRQQSIDSSAYRSPDKGYIDFQELSAAEIDVERQNAVTCRPYRLDDFRALVSRTQKVLDRRVPRGRLVALSEGIHGSKREAFNMTQMVIGRAKEDQKKELCDLMRLPCANDNSTPIKPYFTYKDDLSDLPLPMALYDDPNGSAHRWSPIPDALELIDHLGRKENHRENMSD